MKQKPFLFLFAFSFGMLSYQLFSIFSPAVNPLRGEFHGSLVYAPQIDNTPNDVLGDTTDASGNKHIEVDLTNQRIFAYDGDQKVYEFVVSTGKWGLTPTGDFRIGSKVRSQTMAGGNKAIGTYYYLPNVQWVQYFGNNEIPWSRGFSFHGTYWHNNFGHPMSHGCVNMKTPEAKMLYDWAPMGTRVHVYGSTPRS